MRRENAVIRASDKENPAERRNAGNRRAISEDGRRAATRILALEVVRLTAKPTAARERLARRIREAAPDADRRYREHVYAVDERALHAAGWESDFGAPFSTQSNRGVGWCHPLHGWVWRTGTHSQDWYAQPHGELFRFGPFPSIDDAIRKLETTGGAA